MPTCPGTLQTPRRVIDFGGGVTSNRVRESRCSELSHARHRICRHSEWYGKPVLEIHVTPGGNMRDSELKIVPELIGALHVPLHLISLYGRFRSTGILTDFARMQPGHFGILNSEFTETACMPGFDCGVTGRDLGTDALGGNMQKSPRRGGPTA